MEQREVSGHSEGPNTASADTVGSCGARLVLQWDGLAFTLRQCSEWATPRRGILGDVALCSFGTLGRGRQLDISGLMYNANRKRLPLKTFQRLYSTLPIQTTPIKRDPQFPLGKLRFIKSKSLAQHHRASQSGRTKSQASMWHQSHCNFYDIANKMPTWGHGKRFKLGMTKERPSPVAFS